MIDDGIPPADREFRAAWVATVANIDWPSKPGLSTAEQKAEALAILDKCAELNMNGVVFQARPHCDALYASELEPWSYYITGKQGQAPNPYYDPLEFWVEEAHARGIELHVWFNPYRAHHKATKGELAPNHVSNTMPDVVRKLADGTWWLDPADPRVQDISVNVVMDVVRRYDIDGVHFDDYFYPYPSYNGGKDFPDDPTWEAYLAAGGTLDRGDWRRKAVNDFMYRLYNEIKAEKPYVKFGLSPFGIYRPGYPASIKGFDQYEKLYADAGLWWREGWVDYYTPQCYWPIAQVPQSFPILVAWWNKENKHGRNLWPGLGTYRINNDPESKNFRPAREAVNEIMTVRAIVDEGPGPGHVHFSMKHLLNNHEGVSDLLLAGPYAREALVPPSPWLDSVPPAPPVVTATQNGENLVIEWSQAGDEEAFVWVVYMHQGGAWKYDVVPGSRTSHTVQTMGTLKRTVTTNQGTDVEEVEEPAKPIDKIAVSAVDRCGNESLRTIIAIK